jgi:methylase of polypeptide subunit release factors
MIQVENVKKTDFGSIPVDTFWNTGDEKELKMHRIHTYPAKFPAFITSKTLEFAKKNKVEVERIADIFCGCGTVAYEAKRCNIDFWGCDINPVATMIAKVKSKKYQPKRLQRYFETILKVFSKSKAGYVSYDSANERLKYWYDREHYEELLRLKSIIETTTLLDDDYRLFFRCAFSNILKATSRWLTKSIKPQVDPDKKPAGVISAFKAQCHFMMAANDESDVTGDSETNIINENFLSPSLKYPQVDIIITSPPYVTSYEYADLHQLSSLWLGFAQDYRDLRSGSIGSLYHVYNFKKELKRLNETGSKVVFRLVDQHSSKARSVAKYFLDMQHVAEKCYAMLSKNGMAFFVVGDTEYKGVRIDNARHLAEALQISGFKEVLAAKRKISKKILTPYRDNLGRFTTDDRSRKVYGEEYILIGKK